MANATINVVASLAGQTVPVSVSRQDDGTSLWTPTVAAAQAATGWTQTDASDGVAAMPDGHGLVTGDKIDVFWTGGRRYGMTATVAGDNVTLAGGGGDNLPANGTSVMLCEETAVNAAFNPADLTAILVNVTNRTSVVFVDASRRRAPGHRTGRRRLLPLVDRLGDQPTPDGQPRGADPAGQRRGQRGPRNHGCPVQRHTGELSR